MMNPQMLLLAAVFRQYGRRVPGGYELTISDGVLRTMALNQENGGEIIELPKSLENPGNRFIYSPPPVIIDGVVQEPSTEIIPHDEQ